MVVALGRARSLPISRQAISSTDMTLVTGIQELTAPTILRVRLEPTAKLIRIDLQWNAVVSATSQKPAYVGFSKTDNSKLAALLDVYKLVKQKTVRKWTVRYDNVRKCDSCARMLSPQ
jgi:hypothetical protein